MNKKLLFIIPLIFSSGLFAQGIYNNGGKIVIGSGAFVYISGTGGNYRNETNVSDGAIGLTGTLKLDGNYTNNVAAADILVSPAPGSTVAFTGTTPQTLGGTTVTPFTFSNLTVNNSSGITLANTTLVNGILTLTSGLVNLGTTNLTLGTAATVAGTPSASAMVVATGSGGLLKSFSSTGSFLYPVGDNTGTAEYSPVTLNFTAGTFAPGALAGINLVNAKYNDPAIAGSYLNRYWNVSQTGITAFNCNALFQYVPADVVGTESLMAGLRISPAPIIYYSLANTVTHQLTANGITSFGTYTGSQPNPSLTGPVLVCLNSAGNVYTTDPGHTNYIWIVSAGGLVTAGGTTGSNTVTVTWNTAGPQTVSIQYNGLPSPSVLNVTVSAAFTVGSASANQTVCYNTAPVLLTGIAPTGGITPYTYQWQSSTDNITFTDVPGATGITYQPGALLVTTYYRQNQISAGGCGTFPTNVLTITVVQPPPTLTTITNMTIVSAQHFCADAAQTLTVGDNVTTFHVLNGGVVNLIAGQNIIILPSTIVDPGGYLHAFITTNCFWCSAYPLPSMVTAQPDTTVNEIQVIPFVDKSTSNFFKVYPNPTTGAFTLELSEVPETSVVKVEIYGIYGGKVQNEEFTGQNKHEFTLAGNPTGIYFIRVYCNGNLGTQKIIKQ